MKKIILASAITLLASTAMAESTVDKAVIINSSNNQMTNTQAIGYKNTANTGSTSIQDSKVSKSIMVNSTNNQMTNTQAIGYENTANTGSINAE